MSHFTKASQRELQIAVNHTQDKMNIVYPVKKEAILMLKLMFCLFVVCICIE